MTPKHIPRLSDENIKDKVPFVASKTFIETMSTSTGVSATDINLIISALVRGGYAFIEKQADNINIINMIKYNLSDMQIPFKSHNNDMHFVIGPYGFNDRIIDFWPTTGKWICRETSKHGRGFDDLLIHIGKL